MIPTLLLIAFDAYLSLSIFATALATAPALAWGGIATLQLFFLSLFWLFYIFFQSSVDTKIKFEKPIQSFAFMSMGLISFLFTFGLARDGAALLSKFFSLPYLWYGATPTYWIVGLSLAAFTAGALNARFRITSPKVLVSLPGLASELQGFKMVQLSDMHLGTGPKTAHIKQMVDRALSLKPDLIALTGDIIDGAVSELSAELQELARLRAPHGVYFVLGNHECYWNHLDCIAAIKAAGIQVLNNSGIEIQVKGQTLFVGGMNDPAITHFKGEGPEVPVPPPDSKFNLMLVHQPQLAKKVVESGAQYHLQLSGHTHGGQFFPWNIAVRWMYPIHKGLGKLQDLWIYVSTGSGYWGPPIRLGTDGEVTELVLARTADDKGRAKIEPLHTSSERA